MNSVGELISKSEYNFEDFVEIIRILRAPGGCPWDMEQTHASIRKNFIEETYEAIETIDKGDTEGLCEELGDVMLQVLLHAQMEAEQNTFDINDVVNGICKKLVYRHPHVFGHVSADDAQTVLKNWDNLKKVEKKQKSDTAVIASVSKALPALMRAQKVQSKAAKVGMDFAGYADAKDRLIEEIGELDAAIESGNGIEEELGDMLFSAVNLARFAGCDAEEALTGATDKFVGRFAEVERLAAEQGKKLKELSEKEADELWELAKENLK